ncbi:MAG: hypothetical protein KAR11_08655, partial [Phycisphaerae bacterium]|nr:hypothetical protein [Phycisphaerae bacterium]
FAILAGLGLLKLRLRTRVIYVIVLLTISTLLAIWIACVLPVANGAFAAGMLLIPFYLLVRLWRFIRGKFTHTTKLVQVASVLLVMFVVSGEAFGGKPSGPADPAPIIVPYDGDPTKAADSNKVLIPYCDYVELWNKANPKNTIELGATPVEISFADVQYTATVKGDQLMLKLSADVDVTGNTKQFLTLGNLAVPEAKFAGAPVLLRATKSGTMLVLPAKTRGKLEVTAVATVKISGQKGSVNFTLPPLPAAVMNLLLADETLVLQVPKIGNVLNSKKTDIGRDWTIPLGALRNITLNWAPKTGSGDADKTLSAVAAHEVTVHQWAIMGVSKIVFTSSGGQNKSFALLVPQELTVTEITCDNLRDHSEIGTKIVDGKKYNVVEVRLQKPASKRHELTLRWAEKLPAQNKDFALGLPQASGVARESGIVAIHAAGGIDAKIAKVTGGRQTDTKRSVLGKNIKSVARYYWAYRPFELVCNITRSKPSLKSEINQLVRIDSRRVQLYVDATVTAEGGKLFSTSFSLPKQYELLSVVGGSVDDWYEQPTKSGKLLHVNLRDAVTKAKIVLVLVHNKPKLNDFAVPVVKSIDADGAILKQKGLLALQLNKSLNAQTLKSENLRPMAPNKLNRWLTGKQLRNIQFAYKRTKGDFTLNIKAAALPTKIHAETMGALTVEPTMCMYTYRLRYHISGSPVDHVKFSLPNAVARGVAVTSPSMRNVTQTPGKKRTQWTIWLTDEITGTLDVAVNFTVPLEDKSQIIDIPDVQTDSPQGLRTIFAVQNVSRAKLVMDPASGYTPLSVEQQRKLLPAAVAKNLLCVYQSFGRDLALRLKFEPAPKSSKIQAVIDLMNITTVIDRDGNCRYQVKLSLQNRSEQFLRVKLPDKVSLWSAHVAGQAVKPVTKNRSSSEVLIPLVKTSPGGLPYDVELYLAGKAVEKFGAVTTTIKPPAIEILGIDVVRTTWSLRLPGGYKYGDAKGNMSPILGTAEAMLITSDSKLVQLDRLKKDISSLSSSERARGFRNYQKLNFEIESSIKQTEEYIGNNDGDISEDKLKELNKRVADQRVALQAVNKQYAKGLNQPVQFTGLNSYVNRKAESGGMSDAVRNNMMLSEPEFVKTAGQQLRTELLEEMKQDQKAQKAYHVKSGRAIVGDVPQSDSTLNAPASGFKSNRQRQDESKQMLQNLQQEQLTNVARQRKKRVKQLSQFDTNQMNRANFSLRLASASKSKTKRGRSVSKGRRRTEEPQAAGMGPGMPPRRQVRSTNGATYIGTTRESKPHEVSGALEGGQAWGVTTGGTYSLPVELPDGQVQLDFARPGGAAELSITATPDALGASIWGSVITIAVAALSAAIALLIAKRARKVQNIHMSLKVIIVSLLLVCFAGLLMGFLGFIIVALIVGLMILYRCPQMQKIGK